ncbi:rRNA-processing protein and EBNA1-binding protein ebp2, partial [Turnera subulata]
MGPNNKDSIFSDEDPAIDDETSHFNEETSESESDSGDEDIKLSEPSKAAIYNRDGLNDKLQDVSWPENVDWMHKLSIDIDQEQNVDVNDDLNRELSFYTQALEGQGKPARHSNLWGVLFSGLMVKSDAHMEKVKSRLLVEKKNIEEAEERRKAREAKRVAKAVQAQKQKERAAQKKMEIEAVKKFRKQRQQSGFSDKGDEMGLPFEEGKGFERSSKKRPGVAPGDRSGGKARQPLKGGKKRVEKRQKKDNKFGAGGRKGLRGRTQLNQPMI